MACDVVLALETSCDETAAAVLADGRRVLSNVVATQLQRHRLAKAELVVPLEAFAGGAGGPNKRAEDITLWRPPMIPVSSVVLLALLAAKDWLT